MSLETTDRHITIVMYHYVRNLEHSRYPEIKGLGATDFREQIGYIRKHYNVISGDELIAAVETSGELPSRPLVLTFDDAYVDHFTEVFPLLKDEGLPGCFFPPARCIREKRVLDVNKIHFTLAAVEDKSTLVEEIYEMPDSCRREFRLRRNEEYWEKLAHPSRFDPAEVVFIKRALQRELPETLRNRIVDAPFSQVRDRGRERFCNGAVHVGGPDCGPRRGGHVHRQPRL